jgi:hypothetical protein
MSREESNIHSDEYFYQQQKQGFQCEEGAKQLRGPDEVLQI